MLRIIKSIAGALALGLCLTTGAHAIPVTLNFTADNITSTGGLCDNAACQTGIGSDSRLDRSDKFAQFGDHFAH